LTRAGLLHGKILRPPGYGARLLSLDLSGARELAEVTVVQEGPFVGVAAPDPGTAERALRAIQAEWELEPQPSEHDLVEHLRSHPIDAEGWDGPFHDEVGDVEGALAEASVRLERTYTAAFIAHMPLETRAALADWDGDRLTVWMGTQRPFGVREQVALELGIPEEQVRVIAPTAGGGFGGKHTGEVAIEAARLARASGRPVKVRWSREEELSWGYVRPAAVIDVRSGANSDGTITAWALRNLNSGTAGILSPYTIPNQRIDFQPTASPLRQGSYRALAATANHFARESHIWTSSPTAYAPTRSSSVCATSETSGSPMSSAPPPSGRGGRVGRAARVWASASPAASKRTAVSRRAPRSRSTGTAGSRSAASSPPSIAARSSTPTTSSTRSRARR
jgi:isoquinoline 1-oxidoreductase